VQVGTALENKQSPSHTHTIVATALLSPKLTLAKARRIRCMLDIR